MGLRAGEAAAIDAADAKALAITTVQNLTAGFIGYYSFRLIGAVV
jgi:hypothetical protein